MWSMSTYPDLPGVRTSYINSPIKLMLTKTSFKTNQFQKKSWIKSLYKPLTIGLTEGLSSTSRPNNFMKKDSNKIINSTSMISGIILTKNSKMMERIL